MRKLLRLAAFHRKQIHLRSAVAARKKRQRFSVLRPSRRIVAAALCDLRGLAAVRVDDPDVAHVAVGVHVGRRHSVGHPLAVTGDSRAAQAMQLHHVVESHDALGGRLRM